MAASFTKLLLNWYSTEMRLGLPWKDTNDPYKIWVSEIMLQQTRVEQGIPYYLKFTKKFPDIKALARAHEDEVLKLWEGLGYYSRARNLHFTAKTIMLKYNGKFPEQYDEVLALKGIGPYTAAAIMSFAYKKVYPVIDGNVLRVISRFHAISDAIDNPATIEKIRLFLDFNIDKKNPDSFNQALMDIGATICKPKPMCGKCPFSFECKANQDQSWKFIPFKSKSIKIRDRYFHYLVIADCKDNYILRKRPAGDIWQSLYEFPFKETENTKSISITKAIKSIVGLNTQNNILGQPEIVEQNKHKLTHQTIYSKFYFVKLNFEFDEKEVNEMKIIHKKQLKNLAFPNLIKSYIEKILI